MTAIKKKTTDLIPCPFCGAKPTLVSTGKKSGPVHMIICQDEDCSICPTTGPRVSLKIAIDAWNTRYYSDAMMVSAIDALKTMLDVYGHWEGSNEYAQTRYEYASKKAKDVVDSYEQKDKDDEK